MIPFQPGAEVGGVIAAFQGYIVTLICSGRGAPPVSTPPARLEGARVILATAPPGPSRA